MSSLRLDDFDSFWKKQWTSLVGHHYDERMRYEEETEDKKQKIIDNAELQEEALRSMALPAGTFDDETRKIQETRDASLESIEREYNEHMQMIIDLQQREQANHGKSHKEAMAARKRMNNTSRAHSAATTSATTVDDTDVGAMIGRRTPSASQTPTSRHPGPSREWILPSRDSTPATIASREQDQPAAPAKAFSCTVQRLQEVTGSRAKPSSRIEGSVDPPPTPISAAPPADEIVQVSRTITFEEVYQNGQAEHKDTIIEFPPDSCHWYIVKCEEHGIRFNQRPLQGAAKHLNGRDHGGLDRSWPVALQVLGYRVLNCNEQLATMNNKVVKAAFAMGYKPENRRLRIKRESELAEKATKRALKMANQPPKERRASRKPLGPIITNPKTFHIYYCLWKHHRYPVMILGWDDQKLGGLDLDLVDTGLLKKESNPPRCYTYKNSAIVDWEPRFKDGASRVNRRKFPAMFFDAEKRVSWVKASSLSKFPLYSSQAPENKNHPFNVARHWIAKNEGFSSWKEFEAERRVEAKDTGSAVIAPRVSSPSDDEDSGSYSDAEGSGSVSVSNITEKELEELQAHAGEISGDSDYSASDMDSTLGDEFDEWDEVESDGRPWAFYSLRNKANASPQKAGPSAPTRNRGPTDANPIREGMKAAQRLSARACSPEDSESDSEEESTSRETSPRETPLEGTEDDEMVWTRAVENTAREKDRVISSSTAVIGPNPPRKSAALVHTAQADAEKRTGSLSPTLLTSVPSLSRPSLPEGVIKGLKRARSEEQSEMNAGKSKQENVKKPKVGMDTSGNQVALPVMSKPLAIPTPAVVSFKPKTPPGPAVFELSFYSKGPISWSRENETSCVRLYYGEGNGTVGSIDSPVNVVIDPVNLRALTQEKIPEMKGNVRVTLLGKDQGDTPTTLVFDRAKGSKIDIGKIQVRSFIRWLKNVNPNVRLLDG
ncbi:hypothetical protein GGR51DRAFT_204318 [Nemania sp. FL0031]|nr:hypothetical protein GGR51DRAFT_204318 [Nemania sp. FL0031]